MNESKDLAVSKPQPNAVYIPTQQDWSFMLQWGKQAIQSGMLPNGIKTPEAAAIIVLKGRELGLSFMTAIAHLNIISGKPSMSAELMQAQARKNLPGLKIVPVEVTNEKAVVKFQRPESQSEWFFSSFTMEDAKKAGVTNNPSWQKWPKAMLWSRAVTAGLRIICPESLMGVSYTPEELGAEVNESGEVIHTTSRQVESAPLQIQTPPQNAPASFDNDWDDDEVSPPKTLNEALAKPPKDDWQFDISKQQNLKALRQKAGWSIDEICQFLEISKDQLVKLTREQYETIARKLEVVALDKMKEEVK